MLSTFQREGWAAQLLTIWKGAPEADGRISFLSIRVCSRTAFTRCVQPHQHRNIGRRFGQLMQMRETLGWKLVISIDNASISGMLRLWIYTCRESWTAKDGGFSSDQWLSCSTFAPKSHPSRQNLLTLHRNYHLDGPAVGNGLSDKAQTFDVVQPCSFALFA